MGYQVLECYEVCLKSGFCTTDTECCCQMRFSYAARPDKDYILFVFDKAQFTQFQDFLFVQIWLKIKIEIIECFDEGIVRDVKVNRIPTYLLVLFFNLNELFKCLAKGLVAFIYQFGVMVQVFPLNEKVTA